MKRTLITAAAACAASGALAQISTIGEFAGALNEGFESFPNWVNGGNYDSFDLMTGQATFSSDPVESDQLWIYEPGTSASWGLGSNGQAAVHSGVMGLGIYNSGQAVNARLTFDLVTGRFGGWFGTADSALGNNLTVTFFDAGGSQIGAAQNVSTVGSALVWFGWESTVAIKSVTFTGNEAPAMDDLQAGVVPEPASLLIVGVGVAGLAMLRKKR